MATRPGRIADISRKRGQGSIAPRVHITSRGRPLIGKIERHDQNHSAIFRYVRYTGLPDDSGHFFEVSSDVSISVGRSVSILADVFSRITREIETISDIRLVIRRPVTLESDVRLVVRRPVSLHSDIRLVIRRPMSMYSDISLVIARIIFKNADALLVIRRSVGHTNPAVEQSNQVLEFLGKGLSFPFTFQRRSGGAQISTATSSDHAHIHESIRQILGTKKGERFMRPEFGTRLHELIFESNDRLLYGLIRHEVTEALDQWEPRVIVMDVLVGPSDADDHLVLVNINYRLISSQVEGNLVWPFYRELE